MNNSKRQKQLRSTLWVVAGQIFQFDPEELKIFEKNLNKGPGTSAKDQSLIKISKAIRDMRPKIVDINTELRQDREKKEAAPGGLS